MLLTVGVIAPGTASAQTTDPAALAASLSDMIDGARAQEGLDGLHRDPALAEIALDWSAVMAAADGLSHNPDASAAYDAEWTRFAENVGQALVPGADPAAVIERLHDAFMQSSGHRANVLASDYTVIGTGVVVAEDGRVWVTVNFADATPPPTEPPPSSRPTHYQRPLP